MTDQSAMRGVVHGKVIELAEDSGLPDGQEVSVVLRPVEEAHARGEGLKRAFGGWADNGDDLDAYLAWSRRQRKAGRAGTEL
jgi:hypothetical protein